METRLGIAAMPAHEESDEAWLAWCNTYPSVRAAGLQALFVRRGAARFAFDGDPFPLNPNGAVNGGVVALAADQVMGVLATRMSPTGTVAVTAALQVQYHSPAFPPLVLAAEAIGGGASIRAIEVVVLDGKGRRCATATGTMAVRRTEDPER